jgi:hypothetical protein
MKPDCQPKADKKVHRVGPKVEPNNKVPRQGTNPLEKKTKEVGLPLVGAAVKSKNKLFIHI